MSISRRTLFRHLGAGAAIVIPGFRGTSSGSAAASALANESSGSGVARAAAAPIRLHRNENILGPSPKAIAAMRGAASHAVIRYPDIEVSALRRRIAALHDVPVDRVVLACGARDLLRMAISEFARPPKTIVAAVPTFEMLTEYAGLAGTAVVGVRLRPDYAHDINAMLARIDGNTGLVYVCNPNNPTGSLTPRADLEMLLSRLPPHVVVFMDEAYHDYVGEAAEYASFIDRPINGARMIVARSFSKIHALAGLRVGYAIASAETARTLTCHQSSEGVNVIAARVARAALDDRQHVRQSATRTEDDRQEFLNQANARMLRSVDSLTNFVMLNTGRPAAEVVAHFATHHILVAGPIPGYANYIRVSFGAVADMREFWRVWDLMPGGHSHG